MTVVDQIAGAVVVEIAAGEVIVVAEEAAAEINRKAVVKRKSPASFLAGRESL
jgi:hypothetical protein